MKGEKGGMRIIKVQFENIKKSHKKWWNLLAIKQNNPQKKESVM